MAFETKALDLDSLLVQTSGNQKMIFDIWERHGGLMHPDLLPFYQDIVLFTMPRHDEMPPIMYAGEQSLGYRMMGPGWRSDLSRMPSGSKISDGYLAAADGSPRLEYVRFAKQGLEFAYERLLLPFKRPNGAPQILTISQEIYIESDTGRPTNPESHQCEWHPAYSPVALGLAPSPNSERSGYRSLTV